VKGLRLILDRELSSWVGVTYEIEIGRTHDKIRLLHGDERQFVVVSKTASDYRADKNRIKDVRHTLASMGASRVDSKQERN